MGDLCPQALRHRVDTVSLRGVNVQQRFGSQRALTSVEDFSEFEQREAYFDGDLVLATQKGMTALDRDLQLKNTAEFQRILDFPPAPKLSLDGALNPASATPAELRGQALFLGKAQCASCHSPPYYTDHSLHDLKVERFYEQRLVNGKFATADGAMNTPVLRGIKDSPPYLHDEHARALRARATRNQRLAPPHRSRAKPEREESAWISLSAPPQSPFWVMAAGSVHELSPR